MAAHHPHYEHRILFLITTAFKRQQNHKFAHMTISGQAIQRSVSDKTSYVAKKWHSTLLVSFDFLRIAYLTVLHFKYRSKNLMFHLLLGSILTKFDQQQGFLFRFLRPNLLYQIVSLVYLNRQFPPNFSNCHNCQDHGQLIYLVTR
jgi:hypothetical protein